MERDAKIPMLTANGFCEVHEDDLGFVHGTNNNEAPVQQLVYACCLLKERYRVYGRESDDIYKQWVAFAAAINSQPSIATNVSCPRSQN